MDKVRVLALCDYCCSTGFATVSSNIMQELEKTGRFDLDIVGINHTGDPYDQEKFPGRVFPAVSLSNFHEGDPFGRRKFMALLATGGYDVVFILQDTFVVKDMVQALHDSYERLPKKFKTVFYFPFDCTPKKEWITDVVSQMDYPVTYTNYAKDLAVAVDPYLKEKLRVIYHGTNIKDFYPLSGEPVQKFRREYFDGKVDGKFLVTNVNRNQARKDIIRNLMVLQEIKKHRDDVVLYLHMAHNDAGGNILVMADHFGFKVGEDFIVPHPASFEPNRGLPIEALNLIYNSSDLVLSTTLGEGWGLSITEAMATKTPVVAPDNTSLREILGEGRGILAKCGSTPSQWIMKESDNERLRPLMDVEDAAQKVLEVVGGSKPDIEAAYDWVQDYTWEKVCKQWVEVFDQAALDARTATQNPSRADRRREDRKRAKEQKKHERLPLQT